MVHNNLKGSNILVTDAGIMKISDFGLPQEGVVRHRFYTAPEVTGPAHCQSHQVSSEIYYRKYYDNNYVKENKY